jgi:uncharacterized membrane protein YeaQ/YmgE (transglycosylase-associated protein family)
LESFFEAVGAVGLFLLILVGLLAGWIASVVAGGRHRVRYVLVGVAAALATPFVLTAVGLGMLAAGGLLAVLIVALFGAAVVLVIARLLFR